jgi:hypothetical protein
MWTVITTLLIVWLATGRSLDIRNNPVPSSPGLYYQHESEARLSHSEWKIVTYLSLGQASDNVDIIGKYLQATIDFCRKHDKTLWLNLTECRTMIHDATTRLERLKGVRDLAHQLTRTEASLVRRKRGLFNFIGQISRSLFGTMDSDDEEFFSHKITQLEGDQADLIKLAKEQMVIVKSTLKSVNGTLNDVSKNEMILEKGLQDIKNFINEENGELKRKYTYTSMLMVLNDHAIQLQRALEEVKDEYDIIIQSCLSAKTGVLQPRVLSPNHMIEVLKKSRDSFPRDLQAPVPLSDASAYLLINILAVDVYIVGNNLVYIVRIPLVTHHVYDVYRVLPFPIKINGTRSKYTFIQPEREYLLFDNTKQYYAKFRHEDIGRCKRLDKKHIICQQDFPLLVSHLANDCEVLMLQPIRAIPETCVQRILELTETLWIPLKDNSWIYVAPKANRMTVLCSEQNPTDLEIVGSGILTFLADCTGYGDKVMLRSATAHFVNHTQKDVIPPVYLPLDCCEADENKIHLDELKLDTPLRNILTHNEELQLASYKVKEVQELIEEEEWKLKNTDSSRHLAVLSYIGAAAVVLLTVVLCCCCCRRCRKCWSRGVRWFSDGKGCSAIVFKPKIINSVHTSSDSLNRRGVTLSLETSLGNEGDNEATATELTPMAPNKSSTTGKPSSRNLAVGKR